MTAVSLWSERMEPMGEFETGLQKLEEISRKLQAGDQGIEKSMALYEEGIKLANDLVKKLEGYRSKLEILDPGEKD